MKIRIGNTQAFWGDRNEASSELLRREPAIDYLTLDYLSEVSLSIMAVQKEKDPASGYARDFLDVVKDLVPYWKEGSRLKVITNAGGLDPNRCAADCAEVLKAAGCDSVKIGVVAGDDVVDVLRSSPGSRTFSNMETGESFGTILDRVVTANAYLGAKPIVKALKMGADIVITGRIADPSMAVAPCVAHFDWEWTDYHKIAQATVAGHLIECGTQVTGGISDGWLALDHSVEIGFPIVEIDQDGNIVVMKGKGTGGAVTVETVKEQLVYEIGDPAAYISPDATVSFLSLKVEEEAPGRIRVTGASGSAPPSTLKVSATYRDGYKAEGTLAIVGRGCRDKAQMCGKIILERMKTKGFMPERALVECIGCGDVVPGITPFAEPGTARTQPFECLLRVCIADHRREAMEYFSKQIASLVTSGPPGTTGYTTGRPSIRPVFGYWPCLIDASQVAPKVSLAGGG